MIARSLTLVALLSLTWGSSSALAQPSEPNRFHVYATGEWQSTPEKAKASALDDAQARIGGYLHAQNPPIRIIPSVEWIEREAVRGSVPEKQYFESPLGEMYKLQLEIEVTAEQMREFRGEERLLGLVPGFVLLVGLLGGVFLFFRLDEWTKGYLSGTLGIALAVLAAGAGAAWYFL